jgi:hypothetical protein
MANFFQYYDDILGGGKVIDLDSVVFADYWIDEDPSNAMAVVHLQKGDYSVAVHLRGWTVAKFEEAVQGTKNRVQLNAKR